MVRAFDPDRPGERSFIISTWVRSYGHVRANISRSQYAALHGRLVEKLLSAARARVVVACSENAPDALHGWACGAAPSLHYVYVPPELRRSGLARALVYAALGTYADTIDVTHRWPFSSKRFHFNPYPLMEAA